jgi:hypothetical protein
MKNIFLFLFIIANIWVFGQNGKIEGRIFDTKNNTPIAFADILIQNTKTGTQSDAEGKFLISGLKSGYTVLEVSFIGFKTMLSRDILVSNSNPIYVEIGLSENETELNEVVIKANPFEKKDDALISQQTIGIRDIETNPGSNRDISKVIQSFPGVGSTPNFRNDVIVRGGGPSECRFYLDDVEIPVLNHFSTQGASGGAVGIINADFISSVNYYAGVFPASTNNALSAVFQFTQKDGNRSKFGFQAALGATDASLTLDGPVGKKSDLIFSVRRSYLQFLFAALKLPFLPTYNDYQFKYKININNKNTLTFVSIGSLDNMTLNTGIKNPDPTQEYILSQLPVNNQWSYTFGGVYRHFDQNRSHTFILSRNMLNNILYKYPDNNNLVPKTFDYSSAEEENKFRYENILRKNTWKIEFGFNTEYDNYFNKTNQQLYSGDSVYNFAYKTNLDLYKYGFYGQVSKIFFSQKLKFSLGMRFDGNSYDKKMQNPLNQTSPRFSASYLLNEEISLSIGAGRFFELPAYTTMGFKNTNGNFANSEIPYIGANQFDLGLTKNFGSQYLISAEVFYKNYLQYPIDLQSGLSLANSGADYNSVNGASAVVSDGKGKVSGEEILVRINLEKFTFIGSYTYAKSEFTDIDNNILPSSWDSRNLLTITGTKDFGKNWSFGFKWRFVGGQPYTPWDLEKSAEVAAWNVNGQPYPDNTQLNALRYQPFHELDVRLDKKYFLKKMTVMFYLDIQNAYDLKYRQQDYIIRAKNPDGTYQTTDNGTKYVLENIPNKQGNILITVIICVIKNNNYLC